ncbi:PorP/SprF family type IX secretion system membrane protein [Ferruginibacter albus]|uniref:PorP/SprF family type IX secretion system membrane protein n=1 Tax=Ferruginibacter albus TaxID=2875540 RepID=UPI001CC7AACD|nr:type IX secretion system membrane protein PorP/SprF [Ferruginibacter albus]UAY52644.1 type IX secretion system membrane protein PorP/SprF [Ferruginibacter albus]
MHVLSIIKKIFKACLAIVLILPVSSFAQQRPYYTQYILNNFIINPAVAGIDNYTDVKLSCRNQWVGLEGAPVTAYLTIQAPLQKSVYDEREDATSYGIDGENPLGKPYWFNYKAAPSHQGIGLTIISDETGPLTHFDAFASFSHHQPISAKTTLAMGLSAGLHQVSLDADKLNLYTSSDPAVNANGQLTQMKPDFAAGLLLYNKNYFIGLSVQQILSSQLSFSDNIIQSSSGKLVPHYFLDLGYRFYITNDVSFLPSAMVRYVSPLPFSIDLNGKIQYKQLLWLGATYRSEEGFAAMAGISIGNAVSIGYSYDKTMSDLNLVSNGTHEIVIGFLLGNHYGSTCPRNVW